MVIWQNYVRPFTFRPFTLSLLGLALAFTLAAPPVLANRPPSVVTSPLEALAIEVEGQGPGSQEEIPGAVYRVLDVDIPQRGWLLVEVESSPDMGDTGAIGFFDLIDSDPRSQGDARATVIDRGVDHGLLAVEPGALGLRFGAVDSGDATGWRLATHFVPWNAGTDRDKDGDEGDDSEVGNGEVVPQEGTPDDRREDTPESDERDGEEGDDSEVGNGEVVPTAVDANDDPWWQCLLGNEPYDDFGLCATTLWPGARIDERLGELRTADRDYFTFDLDTTARVRIGSHGQLDTTAVLFHEGGRTLARADQGGEGDNFQIVANLVPGTYLLRVEGIGEPRGDYQIAFDIEEMTNGL